MQREYSAKLAGKVKRLVFGHYSNGLFACACCGESELDFLTIDYIKNDGARERLALFGRRDVGGYTFYRWLIKNGFPSGHAALCMNCNFSKGKHGVRVHTKSQAGVSDPLLRPQMPLARSEPKSC